MSSIDKFTPDKIGRSLTPEQEQLVMDLGALNWTYSAIATTLNVDGTQFELEATCLNSIVNGLIARGRLEKGAMLEISLMDLSIAGNIKAVKELMKVRRDKSFQLSKLDIFGGFEDEATYNRIMEYIDSGSSGTLSTKEQHYIDMLNLIFSLSKQHDKRNVIKFITKPPFSLSHKRAADMYAEAVNLFYSEKKITKSALRNKFAEDMENLAELAKRTAISSADLEVSANIRMKAAKILGLDQDDPETLPVEQYARPIQLHTANPEAVGLQSANRDDLARQIEELDLSSAVKHRLAQEGGIEDVNFIEIIDNGTQEEG